MIDADRDTARIETLSDAVFAFAATLLVVSLEVPSSYAELIENLYGFVAFGLTFGALILLWSIHRAYFRRYRIADGWTLVLNSVLLFLILFYVYPLKFIAQSLVQVLGLVTSDASRVMLNDTDELSTVFILYSVGFGAIFLCVTMMYRHAARRSEELGLSQKQRMEASELSRHYLLFTLVALLSVGLAALQIGLLFGGPGIIYALLGPLCYAHAKWSEGLAAKTGGVDP